MSKENPSNLPTTVDVAWFVSLTPLLESLYVELKDLSKKKQDEILNILKVKMTNKLLIQIRELLKNEITIDFLNLLDEETLPSNSDAVLIISQYRAVIEQYENLYTDTYGDWKTID